MPQALTVPPPPTPTSTCSSARSNPKGASCCSGSGSSWRMDRQRHVRGLRDHLGPFPFLYEDVLAEEGVTDFDQYACVPGAEPQVDEFVDHI